MPWNEKTGIPEIDEPWKNPLAALQGGQSALPGQPQIPGPVGAPSVVGQQIPTQAPGMFPGLQELLSGQSAPAATQAAAPLPTPPSSPMPALPKPDYSQVPSPQPLSTPREVYSNTRSGARANSIAQGIAGFREGAQRGEAIADRRAANKYKMAEARINTISQDQTKTPEQKTAEIGAILNDPMVQRGARVVGVELPMQAPTGEEKKPGLMSRIGGALMSGVTGVPQQPRAGKVDVGGLPQMNAAAQAQTQAQTLAAQRQLESEKMIAELPQKTKDLLLKRSLGLVLSPAEEQKLRLEIEAKLAEMRAKHALDMERVGAEEKGRTERSQANIKSREAEGAANRTSREKIGAARISVSGGKEQGSYIPVTDSQGNITGAWNPKSGGVAKLPEDLSGARKSGVPGSEMNRQSVLMQLQEDMGRLSELAKANTGAIGPVAGRLESLKAETVGTSPDITEMMRISANASDMLLRARSGAQINEQEYQRLSKLVPDPKTPASTFFSRLDAFKKDVDRLVTRTVPAGSAARTPVAAPNSAESLQQQLDKLPDGSVVGGHKKVAGKWVPVQ